MDIVIRFSKSIMISYNENGDPLLSYLLKTEEQEMGLKYARY